MPTSHLASHPNDAFESESAAPRWSKPAIACRPGNVISVRMRQKNTWGLIEKKAAMGVTVSEGSGFGFFNPDYGISDRDISYLTLILDHIWSPAWMIVLPEKKSTRVVEYHSNFLFC